MSWKLIFSIFRENAEWNNSGLINNDFLTASMLCNAVPKITLVIDFVVVGFFTALFQVSTLLYVAFKK